MRVTPQMTVLGSLSLTHLVLTVGLGILEQIGSKRKRHINTLNAPAIRADHGPLLGPETSRGLPMCCKRRRERQGLDLTNPIYPLDKQCAPGAFQKNPRVRKICVRNSGAGNGCANFMDTWKKCVRSAGKAMSIKFLVLGGGGGILGFGGGGECRFYFYGRADFSEHCKDRGFTRSPWEYLSLSEA